MGGKQAADVMRTITEQNFTQKGIPLTPQVSGQIDVMGQKIADRIDRESTAYFATARLWDDGLIDPRDSRRLLGELLFICRRTESHTLHPNTFGVARM